MSINIEIENLSEYKDLIKETVEVIAGKLKNAVAFEKKLRRF